ncbi:MAG TPA: NADH-quinone oxidoreductase subunit A [Elusimicrobia bacterium]|nr:NADH-quinone oxidoreductase subunit A [Elusimicrobiota bacterium]
MDYSFTFDYLILIIFILTGSSILGIILFISSLIRPSSKSTPDKLLPYECGNIPTGTPWIQFRIHYYIFALIFVVFDAVFIFLFPWAIVFKELGTRVFLAGIIFVCIPVIGLIYLTRKGILKWI